MANDAYFTLRITVPAVEHAERLRDALAKLLDAHFGDDVEPGAAAGVDGLVVGASDVGPVRGVQHTQDLLPRVEELVARVVGEPCPIEFDAYDAQERCSACDKPVRAGDPAAYCTACGGTFHARCCDPTGECYACDEPLGGE